MSSAVQIVSMGQYLPRKVVSSASLEERLDLDSSERAVLVPVEQGDHRCPRIGVPQHRIQHLTLLGESCPTISSDRKELVLVDDSVPVDIVVVEGGL